MAARSSGGGGGAAASGSGGGGGGGGAGSIIIAGAPVPQKLSLADLENLKPPQTYLWEDVQTDRLRVFVGPRRVSRSVRLLGADSDEVKRELLQWAWQRATELACLACPHKF